MKITSQKVDAQFSLPPDMGEGPEMGETKHCPSQTLPDFSGRA